MFDHHQAEITVMQFRGHSLPVHQSMSVPWEFYLVPFHQPNPPTQSLSITGHWNVSLPSSASLWNGMFAQAEGQNTTTDKWGIWLVKSSILLNFSESEVFAGEALVLEEISFFILLSLVWTLDLFSYLTLKIFIFIEGSPDWGLAN